MLTKFTVLTKPSLRNLAFLLRNRFLWPESFKWDYSRQDTCAMGLCEAVWGKKPSELGLCSFFTEFRLFLTGQNHRKIWGVRIPFTGIFRDVTPEMVADRIEDYLR